jgi:chemotaxis protein methyltransferase CheR
MRGPLDVVFCRNVMIYFDHPVRQALVTDIERVLDPEGTLFIGHAESLTGLRTRFQMVKPSVYVLAHDPARGPQRTGA